MNTQERTQFVVGQTSTGLRSEWSHVEELESSLERRLHEAQARATPHIPAGQRAAWEQDWKTAQEHLDVIRAESADARRHFDAGETADSLNSWLRVMEHDRALNTLLEKLRTTGREAVLPLGDSDPWYDSWKLLWIMIDNDLAAVRSHTMTARFRLEMRKQYGEDIADPLTQEILEHLPKNATLQEAEKFADEFRTAHLEFEQHRDHPTIRDIIRGLFLLPEETPDDHLLRQRAAEVRRRAMEALGRAQPTA